MPFPTRPTQMGPTNLPNFAQFADRYEITVALGKPANCTIRSVLKYRPDLRLCCWDWTEHHPEGIRRGTAAWHLVQDARAHARRDALEAMRAAGWTVDFDAQVCFAPLTVWSGALAFIY